MAKEHPPARTTSAPSAFEEARDELFQHIMRCGVVGAEPDDQKAWFDETLAYMTERFHELNAEHIGQLEDARRAVLRSRRRSATPSPPPDLRQRFVADRMTSPRRIPLPVRAEAPASGRRFVVARDPCRRRGRGASSESGRRRHWGPEQAVGVGHPHPASEREPVLGLSETDRGEAAVASYRDSLFHC